VLKHLVVTELFERHSKREGLRDRLNRERTVARSCLEQASVGGGDADAEVVWIRLAQFRNVRGDLAGVDRQAPRVDVVDHGLELLPRRNLSARMGSGHVLDDKIAATDVPAQVSDTDRRYLKPLQTIPDD
jgi:hypothetical protein